MVQTACDGDHPRTAASAATKQLLVRAADRLVDRIWSTPDDIRDELLARSVLPAAYAARYDERFVDAFRNVVEQTRNALVADLPAIGTTAGELAAHAIFAEARRMITEDGSAELTTELDELSTTALEDADVLSLFQVPRDAPPEEFLSKRAPTADWEHLRFENWFLPFGGTPRPHITYDGRAWLPCR